jgi:hypothetical protein
VRLITGIWILWVRYPNSSFRITELTPYAIRSTFTEHPINAVVLTRPTSNPLLSAIDRAAPPTAWPSNFPVNAVGFPSTLAPVNLTHAPSISSATSSSTYKVTVHRRRIHSRTSFPEANRALDHLHSSSPVTATNTPSISPRSSSGLPDVTPAEFTPRNVHAKPSAIPKIRDQTRISRGPDSPSRLKQSLDGRKDPPPSLLPRRSPQQQSVTQKPIHEVRTRLLFLFA